MNIVRVKISHPLAVFDFFLHNGTSSTLGNSWNKSCKCKFTLSIFLLTSELSMLYLIGGTSHKKTFSGRKFCCDRVIRLRCRSIICSTNFPSLSKLFLFNLGKLGKLEVSKSCFFIYFNFILSFTPRVSMD